MQAADLWRRQRALVTAVRRLLLQWLKRGRGQREAHGRRRDRTALAFLPAGGPAPFAPADVPVEQQRPCDAWRGAGRHKISSVLARPRRRFTGAGIAATARLVHNTAASQSRRRSPSKGRCPGTCTNHRFGAAAAATQLCWNTPCTQTTRSRRTPCPPPWPATTTRKRRHCRPSSCRPRAPALCVPRRSPPRPSDAASRRQVEPSLARRVPSPSPSCALRCASREPSPPSGRHRSPSPPPRTCAAHFSRRGPNGTHVIVRWPRVV